MKFKDRLDAAHQLARALKRYAEAPETLLVALPRGGVVLGAFLSKALHLPLEIICPRKIGAPHSPEFAIGAVTESGECFLSDLEELGLSLKVVQPLIEEAALESKRRSALYRGSRKKRSYKNQRVILVDDGLATGSTMWAALQTVKQEEAKEVIIAVPISSLEATLRFKREEIEVIALETSADFFAISQFYDHFEAVSDEEVIALLKESH